MEPLDALWHLLNFFAPAVGVGLIGSALVKLLWRRSLAGVRWRRLAQAAVLAGCAVLIVGLPLFGRDGTMATYGLLVVAAALAMGWVGFVRPSPSD